MTNFLLLVFGLECSFLLYWGLRQPDRIVQFPFLATLVYLGWVFPQFLGLIKHSHLIPAHALDKALVMTILCLASCFVGDRINRKAWPYCNWQFNSRRLLSASTVLSLVGFYFFYETNLMAEEATKLMGGQWSGGITVYAFFTQLLTFGLVIAMLVLLKRPSIWAFALVSFDCLVYLHKILMSGRRAAMAELFVIFLLSFWFQKRWLPSRLLVLTSACIGVLVVNNIGEYRGIVVFKDEIQWADVGNIDFVENLLHIADEGAEEVKNAAYLIDIVDRTSKFDFGLFQWDQLVFAYVPGQWLGADFKRSLYLAENQDDLLYGAAKYIRHGGTTTTGMADSFASFWYFGAINFVIISFIMCKLYLTGRQGNFIAQFLTIVLMTPALHAITHSSSSFVRPWLQILVFVGPLLFYAKVKQKKSRIKGYQYLVQE